MLRSSAQTTRPSTAKRRGDASVPSHKRLRLSRLPAHPPSPAFSELSSSSPHSPSGSTESDLSPSELSDIHHSRHNSDSRHSSPIAATTPITSATADTELFKPDDCKPSHFPIFRDHQRVTYQPPPADLTKDELQRLTFRQWLDYWLGHPAYKKQRTYMFTDEQYCLLLGYMTGKRQRVVDYKGQLNLDKQMTDWLYRQTSECTYQYAVMEYNGGGPADIDKGPVLVCFKEPALDKGGKTLRRKRHSTSPTTANLARRCVPFSQIEQVVKYAHNGHLNDTVHRGQGATWEVVNAKFDGVTRNIVRKYVAKCAICQQNQTRTYKAALVPILSKTQCERVVFDLIDFSTKPSHGYRYILHAVDHFSKFHWAWAIPDKQARTVAYCLNQLLSVIGAIRYPQCDQGTEFVAEVLDVLAAYKCGPVCNSSAYHPQTNGLVERGNSMLKSALERWFIQEESTDWYVPLGRIVLQLNNNRPRTTRHTPYELLFAKKPADFDGELNQAEGPLSVDHLTTVLNVVSLSDRTADKSASVAGASAAELLSSMAVVHSSGSSSSALPHSQSVLSVPSSPLPNSLLPLSYSPGPVSQSLVPAAEYDDPSHNPDPHTDCCATTTGALHDDMAAVLNVGCTFMRLGGEGGGRCAFSAFYNALRPMDFVPRTSDERRAEYDRLRYELRQWWERLSEATGGRDASERERIIQLQMDLGTGGVAEDDQQTDQEAGLQPVQTIQKSGREACWQQLGVDLLASNKSLGPDTLLILARQHKFNLLLFSHHTEMRDYGAGTREAANKWNQATDEEKRARMAYMDRRTTGGRWTESEQCGTQYSLVPPYIKQDRPFIVLFARTVTTWHARQGRPMSTSSGGHFEAVVKRTRDTAGVAHYTGVYQMGGDTAAEYHHCLTLAQRYMAGVNQKVASDNMAAQYDRKQKLHQFKLLDAVGVRVPGKNPRKGDTSHSVPGLVIGITERQVGSTTKVTHKMYTVWCAQGVLSQPIKLDKLVPLSINNFSELLEFRDRTLKPAERLQPTNAGWQSPLLGTASTLRRVEIGKAWKQQLSGYTQRTVDQSRQRTTTARTAAVAAETALQVSRADERRAASLASLSNQAAPARSTGTRGSYITKILGTAGLARYRVQWSEPEGNPAVTTELRTWLDTSAEYVSVVRAYRQQQLAGAIELSGAEDDKCMAVEEAEMEGEQGNDENQWQTSESDAD